MSLVSDLPRSDDTNEVSSSLLCNVKDDAQSNYSCENVRSSVHHDFILPQKAVIFQLEHLQKKRNYEHNDLIKALHNCKKLSLKLFELAVNGIDPQNPPEDRTVYIDKKLVFTFLGQNNKNQYGHLKNSMFDFVKDMVLNFSIDEKEEIKIISAIEDVSSNPDMSYISLTFSKGIMPYISKFKEAGFTQYEIFDMQFFESKYSIILYKWLVMNFNQFKKYNNPALKNPKISIEELRKITGTEENLARFGNFEKVVLKKAQSEINKFSKIYFEYEKIQKGKYITEIQFSISENEKNMPAPEVKVPPRVSKEEREKQTALEMLAALESTYTDILSDTGYLSAKDQRNRKIMLDLVRNLYPVFDRIMDEYGLSMKKLKEYLIKVKSRRDMSKPINSPAAFLLESIKSSEKSGEFGKPKK